MKRSFTVCCLFVLSLATAPALAGHRSNCGSGYRYGGNYWGGVRPSFLSSGCRSPYYVGGGGYWGGYYRQPTYTYQPPVYYGGSSSVVVIRQPKLRPDISIVNWDENQLEELARSKFVFSRGLSEVNRVRLQIVSRDYHGDTGALKKVKLEVRWIIFKHLEKHDEEVEKHDTVKLKFDEYGRFTEFDD
ncbi:hypothetical protein IT398_01105 [Candidatus Nomurabacteria bacterium]|nr:hypothetical protein [Candidatus Nomurabacteria bacterium]